LSPVDSYVDFFSRDKFCAASFIIEPCGTHGALDCRGIQLHMDNTKLFAKVLLLLSP